MSHKQAKHLRKAGIEKPKSHIESTWIGDYSAMATQFSCKFGNESGYLSAFNALAKSVKRHMGTLSKTYQPNGAKECARRVRQMQSGKLQPI